ncbi:MAG: hypothetical protein AB1898_10420 [Acidobacteriota bacterium]
MRCQPASRAERLAFDFESDAELDHFFWSCHTLFERSTQHASRGRYSLRVKLYPSRYPGISPSFRIRNWSSYKTLHFDVFNPAPSTLTLYLRIDDAYSSPAYEDRYNGTLRLQPGLNRLSIALDTLETSGTKRTLDPLSIKRFALFLNHPREETTLYFDNFRFLSR